jgi:outer membrane lipoprotein-sorting protein
LQDYDPTQHKGASVSYLGSEIVNNVDCNVFRGKGNVGQTKTFWVDKNNGLTLKYTESSSTYGESVTYEVITYQLKPDWDALHLHPLATDKVWEQ